MEHVIAETVNYIKNIFLNDFSGHDYFHSLRVYRVAGTIAEKENAYRMRTDWMPLGRLV